MGKVDTTTIGVTVLQVAVICILYMGLPLCADAAAINTEIKPDCPADQAICKITWILTQEVTMVLYEEQAAYPLVFQDGQFEERQSCEGDNQYTPIDRNKVQEHVNQNSGIPKFVYTVNSSSPGGTLVVYENQTVEVTVINHLLQESTGIHWHGMYQRGTPYMDGVTSVTQCPINLQETFVYRFKPEPTGTHWYHSHTALQRTDGLFGGLIILPTEEREGLPSMTKDFLAMFHDYHQLNSVLNFHASINNFKNYLKNGFDETCAVDPVATLINGIGYLTVDDTNTEIPDAAIYTVKEGGYYRIRFLNAGLFTAYLVEIDQHEMTVISSDGIDLEPYTVDGLVVHIGERFDVYIHANQNSGNYWIRFTKLSATGIDRDSYNKGYAILNYDGIDPTTRPDNMLEDCWNLFDCKIVNCPFKSFSDGSIGYECSNIGDLNSTGSTAFTDDIEEHFFVFGFTTSPEGKSEASVNAIHYVIPSKPPVVAGELDLDRPCSNYNCEEQPCRCTHIVKITLNKTIQFVFASSSEEAHPIHLHGHDFQVVKVVYGEKNSGVNPDINCQSSNHHRCTNPTWSNKDWLGGNVPNIKTQNPPEKDTVIVPGGGYVVVRFKADNPGFWMMHCHIEFHLEEGMGLTIQEGEFSDMPSIPTGFPTCGSFRFNQETAGTEGNGATEGYKMEYQLFAAFGVFWTLLSTTISQ